MSLLDFYRFSFLQFGYPETEVDEVMRTAGTDDYYTLVTQLHARDPEVAGAASRDSARSDAPPSPLLKLLSRNQSAGFSIDAERPSLGSSAAACTPLASDHMLCSALSRSCATQQWVHGAAGMHASRGADELQHACE